jgi:hypothetical protein
MTFTGLSSRSGPLTWAQRWTWDILKELEPRENRINFVIRIGIDSGHSVDDVVAVLTDVVGRHEVLRTTYHERADGEDVEQVVHGSGTIPVTVRDAGAEQASDVMDALAAQLGPVRFDLAADLPVRAGVVVRSGKTCHLVLVVSNMALDGWSLWLLERELTVRMGGSDAPPAPGWPDRQPLDQAADERSPAGVRTAEGATRHWSIQLSQIARIPAPAWVPAGESPRFWCAEFTSTAISRAAHAVAATQRVPPSAVLLAAVAALVGLRKGQSACGLFVVASNRYQPTLRGVMGKLNQSSPMCLDLAADTFADLAAAAAKRLLRASRFGQCDPMRVAPLVHGPGPHRGAHLALPVVFDYHHREETGIEPTLDPDELRAAAVGSTLRWLDALDDENMRLYVQVHQFDTVARIALWIDSHYLSRSDLAAVIFGAERLLVEAARGTVQLARLEAITGVPGASSGNCMAQECRCRGEIAEEMDAALNLGR